MNKTLSQLFFSVILVLGWTGIDAYAVTPIAPIITTQPVNNVTVIAPATATFKVVATGTPTPSYQWMLSTDGVTFTNVIGATKASYTTPATTVANNGTLYECVVTNAAGSVTSTAASLTVNAAVPPSITSQPVNNITVTAPAAATFKVVATGSPTPTYQWASEAPGTTSFSPISGATSASYATGATATTESGTLYECIVTNSAESVTSAVASLTVNAAVPPSIITQPVNNVTVIAPTAATFKVVATGTPTPTYQWMQSTDGVTFTNITGAKGASYSTGVTTTAESGTQYECVITNEAGSVTSAVASLTVNAPVAPSFTTQPDSITITAPAIATFKVTAIGTPTPTYQWMQSTDGVTFTNITGATSASYATGATTTSESGTQYECVITNTVGSVTSNAVTLTVNPTEVAPSITTQPINVTVIAPATAAFKVVAAGVPTPTYQWMQSTDGVTFTNVTGATKASYTTPATTVANSGTFYECLVTNIVGSVTSVVASLTVNASVPPSIITQPVNNLTVTAPASATFKVVATGTPTPTYQWESEAPGTTSFSPISGATSASYATGATTTVENETQYECVVTNSAGNVTSAVASLTVNAPVAPSIITQPVNNITVTAPATATFKVVATGTPTPTYQWMQSTDGLTFTNITGATSASYSTGATTTAENGTLYECVITNEAGSVTSNTGSLTVNAAVPPSITTQPVNNVTVTAPAAATFKVVATGTPTPTYQWMQSTDGVTFTNITGATGASYATGATTTTESGTQYECVVTNEVGSVTSSASTLTVNPAKSVAPIITTQPVNAIVSAPAPATFTIVATGTPAPNYQWQQGILAGRFVSFNNIPGATSSSYIIPSTTLADSGTLYDCVVSNTAGSVTSNTVNLTVNPQPVVSITSPTNQSTITTGSINITAIATENGGMINNVAFYNGTTLLGTVSSTSQAFTYPWPNIPAGTYNLTAVATDSLGNTSTSLPITFTINSAPYTYAIDNILLTKTDARGSTTSYQYDNLNRLLQTTFADGSSVSQAYDLFGNQISVTDQRGNTLTKTYDAYERLFQTKDPLGGITQFNYDNNGDLLNLTDANNHSTTYTYDGDYRVLTQTNALNFTTAFSYDPVGNVSTRTDANGKSTNYTYDALNRLTNTAYPDGTSVANAYDAIGRKTSMTDATGATSYAYDALNHLLTKTSPGANNAISYTYDSEGNRLTSVDQNSRTITNAYDTLNRLASVTDPNGTTNYGYDAVSNKISVSSPNGVTESYTYDALNRVLSDVNATNARVISSFSNVYDIAGMITKKTLQDGSWTAYSYDALKRLLEETKQTSASIIYDYVYTYDPVGNRLTWMKNTTLGGFWNVDYLNMPPQVLTNLTSGGYGNSVNPNLTLALARTYSYDAANRLSSWNYAANINTFSFPIQTDTYTYDNNGNRLTKQAVLTGESSTQQQTTYSYDFENRLNKLNYINIPYITGTQADNFTYNGEGLRTQAVRNTTTDNYLYDGSNVLVKRDGSGNTTKSYTRGLDLGGGIGSLIALNIPGANPVTQYYDYNDLGSVADTTTSTGTAASDYSYDAFGNLLSPQASGDTNRYLFSTKEFEIRSGLDYFGGRYYDPEIGRWLTPDPLGFVDGTNVYAYVNNNPINLVDPLGLFDGYLFTKSVVGLVAYSAVAVTGTAFAETGFGAVAAVYGAYGVGASAGNIINSITNNGAGPTGPGQTVGALYGYATNTNSTTFQTLGSVSDLAVPLIAGGANPSQVSEIDALLLSNENTALQTTQTLTRILNATQVADAGFTLGESGNTLNKALTPYLNNNAGNSNSNNLGGKEHAFY